MRNPLSSQSPFYRSGSFRLVLIFAGLVSAWTCEFGPGPWHRTSSLILVRSYGLPWWFWGLCFLAFSVTLSVPAVKWHVRGCWFGLVVYGIFFVSVVAAIRHDKPANLIFASLAAVGLAAIYQAAKLATFAREGL